MGRGRGGERGRGKRGRGERGRGERGRGKGGEVQDYLVMTTELLM